MGCAYSFWNATQACVCAAIHNYFCVFQVWLGDLAKEMKDTLKALLVECLNASKKGSGGGVDPSKFPSQVRQLTNLCKERFGLGCSRLPINPERVLVLVCSHLSSFFICLHSFIPSSVLLPSRFLLAFSFSLFFC